MLINVAPICLRYNKTLKMDLHIACMQLSVAKHSYARRPWIRLSFQAPKYDTLDSCGRGEVLVD